jgi:hypothetical protein
VFMRDPRQASGLRGTSETASGHGGLERLSSLDILAAGSGTSHAFQYPIINRGADPEPQNFSRVSFKACRTHYAANSDGRHPESGLGAG